MVGKREGRTHHIIAHHSLWETLRSDSHSQLVLLCFFVACRTHARESFDAIGRHFTDEAIFEPLVV